MPATPLGKVFGQIETTIDDALNVLQTNVAAAPYEKDVSLDTGNKSLPLFGTTVTLDATLKAGVSVAGPNQVPYQPFGDGSVTVPPGQFYTALTIDGTLSASAQASGQSGVLQLSASGSAKSGFSYAHLLAVPASDTRLAAFLALGGTSTLPQLADLKSLADGEILDFTGTFNLDLGLKAKYGANLSLAGQILGGIAQGLSIPYTAHVAFTLEASLGFSLYDSMHLTVGKAGQTSGHEHWARIRLDREHKDRIAFGIAYNLAIDYDAATGAQLLLDKAFALLPSSHLIDSLKEITDLPSNLDDFKAKISDKLAAVVGQLVDDTNWKQTVAGSDAVKKLIDVSNRIVTAYKQIDQKAQSLFEEVLAKLDDAGLAQVLPIIKQIAALDSTTFDKQVEQFFGPDSEKVVHWIEVLSGRSLEDLVVSGTFKTDVDRAVALAKQLDGFLSGGGATDLVKAVHSLLDRTGATALVTWLQANTTSVAALQAAGDKAVGDIVRKLIGKELDKLNADDLKSLQAFAKKLHGVLSLPDDLAAKLKTAVSKLKGTLGFNVALEISRVSESSSIVDVEIDPQNAETIQAAANLQHGDVQHFLIALNNIDTKNNPTPFLIRETLLTSRHVRTSASNVVFSFLGVSLQGEASRVTETSVSIEGNAGVLTRNATYSGGDIVRISNGAGSFEGGAWMRFVAKGPGSALDSDYTSVTPAMRLTYLREFSSTDTDALNSIRHILFELGIGAAAQLAATGAQTRFALEIELDEDAFKSVLSLTSDKNGSAWNNDARNAASVWFADGDQMDALVHNNGLVMTKVVLNETFGQLWTGNLDKLIEADQSSNLGLPLGVRITGNDGHGVDFLVQYESLGLFVKSRNFTFAGYKNFHLNAIDSMKPSVLISLIGDAAALFDVMEGNDWTPPLFNFWLVLARLARLAPAALQRARGAATLRSRQDDKSDWSDPAWVQFKNGINADVLKEVFPL